MKTLNSSSFSDGYGLLSILVEVGFASSNSEARKSIQNGAIRLNDINLNDPSKFFQVLKKLMAQNYPLVRKNTCFYK